MDINFEKIQLLYGDEYLEPLILSKSAKHLSQVFPYLDSLGVLPIVLNSGSILTLTVNEIKERKSVLDKLGLPLIKGQRFHPIFGLSKKNYRARLTQLNLELTSKKYIKPEVNLVLNKVKK